jgi:hypothetical protein
LSGLRVYLRRMSMGTFVDTNRKRAAELLRQMSQQELTSGIDPILELVGCLLEDGAGGASPMEFQVTTEDWHTWNQLALSIPNALAETVEEVLERERLEIPAEKESLWNWAACLILCTLEYTGMR